MILGTKLDIDHEKAYYADDNDAYVLEQALDTKHNRENVLNSFR